MNGNFHTLIPPTHYDKFLKNFYTKDWIISEHFYDEWKITLLSLEWKIPFISYLFFFDGFPKMGGNGTLTAIQSSWSQTTQSWIQTFRPVTSNPSVLKAVRSMMPWWSSLVLLALADNKKVVTSISAFNQTTWSHSNGLPARLRCAPRMSSKENSRRTDSPPECWWSPGCWTAWVCSPPWRGSQCRVSPTRSRPARPGCPRRWRWRWRCPGWRSGCIQIHPLAGTINWLFLLIITVIQTWRFPWPFIHIIRENNGSI